MSWTPGIKFFRTTKFRLSLIVTAMMAVFTSLMVYAVFILLVLVNLNSQHRAELDAKLLSYRAVWEHGGMEGVITRLSEEMRQYSGTPFLFLAKNYVGETVSSVIPGNWESFGVENLKIGSEEIGTYIRLGSSILPYSIMVSGLILEDGSGLFVGVSMENNRFLTRILLQNYPLVLLVIVFAGIGVGTLAAQRLLRPIVSLNREIDMIIVTGELNRRLITRGTGDQIDGLVDRYNRLLNHVDSLIRGMTNTLNAVAHDLRTPLTRLRGHAEIALGKGEESDRVDALNLVVEQTDQVSEILTAIMDMAEADQTIPLHSMRQCNLNQLSQQVCDMYSLVMADKSQKIRIHNEGMVSFEGEPGRVRRILGNLIDNAVKYSSVGGTIDIYTGRTSNRAWFKILDDGPGIPEKEMSRVFDKLYRLDSNRNPPGLGLGLSIVKALVERHNGEVRAKPLYGRGVCFEVFFPLFRGK